MPSRISSRLIASSFRTQEKAPSPMVRTKCLPTLHRLKTAPTLFPISPLSRGVFVLLLAFRTMRASSFSVAARRSSRFLFHSPQRRRMKQAISRSPGRQERRTPRDPDRRGTSEERLLPRVRGWHLTEGQRSSRDLGVSLAPRSASGSAFPDLPRGPPG
jgi:hypothetical protein